MKYYAVCFCLLFAIVAGSFNIAKAQAVNINDSLALVDLYNSTNGPAWTNHTNWLTGPVKAWFGVAVTGRRVSSVSLSFNYLNGSIPSSVGNLGELSYLSFYNNSLTGTIPSSIGNLIQLQSLDFSFNQLSGSIPASIGNLPNLSYLNLYYNQLRGSVPASIGNLTNLSYLNLNSNQLTGNIPAAIGKLSNLTYLSLAQNQLSGTIPAAISNLLKLEELDLSGNQLSGSIPPSIGKLTALSRLTLSSNQLSDAIPFSLGNLTNLGVLGLSNNQLSGPIPLSLGNLAQLFYLYLQNNQLSGSIPSSIGKLTSLVQLNLYNNRLSGEIPAAFKGLQQLQKLDVGKNLLTQSENVDFPLARSQYIDANLIANYFTFNGMEFVAQTFPKATYFNQAIIPLHQNGNTLSVSAGGTLSNNTYKWYGRNSVVATITGDSTFHPAQSNTYYAVVTNAVATQLALQTQAIDYTVPVTKTAEALQANSFANYFSVYPNPAKDVIQVQVNGNAILAVKYCL